MSNNAVFCISNNTKTVRLTVYRCKPNIFLMQLEKALTTVSSLDVDDLVMYFIDNGFELDADTSASFNTADMCTNSLVNWAWLLDLDNKTLQYWDVTAALNGLQYTIGQNSISPLDYSNWLGSDVVDKYKSDIVSCENKLNNIGIKILNY